MATQGLEQFITYNASHAEGPVALFDMIYKYVAVRECPESYQELEFLFHDRSEVHKSFL